MITDWDDAYANSAYIPETDEIVAGWERDAASYRADAKGELDLTYGICTGQLRTMVEVLQQSAGTSIRAIPTRPGVDYFGSSIQRSATIRDAVPSTTSTRIVVHTATS